MNTVDALNVLGKALCGDSFEVKPGLTDAETILEIAKNYTGGSGGGDTNLVFDVYYDESMTVSTPYEDIVAAVNAGKRLKLIDSSNPDDPGFTLILAGTWVHNPGLGSFIQITGMPTIQPVGVGGNEFLLNEMRIESDGSITHYSIKVEGSEFQ